MEWNDLLAAARAVRLHAHVPYSQFAVGAALIADDGLVYTGCNVENASFGLTNCAERTAIFQMMASGAKRIKALVVVAEGARPVSPCGACRQVMAEFAESDTPVMMANLDGQTRLATIGELLPYAFEKGDFHGHA